MNPHNRIKAGHNDVKLYTELDGELVSHFSLWEFENKEGVAAVHPATLLALEQVHRDLRLLYPERKVTIKITSATRTAEDLAALGARLGWIDQGGSVARDSQHQVKYASNGVDFYCYVAGEDGIKIPIPTSVTGSIVRKYFDYVNDGYNDRHTHGDTRNRAL